MASYMIGGASPVLIVICLGLVLAHGHVLPLGASPDQNPRDVSNLDAILGDSLTLSPSSTSPSSLEDVTSATRSVVPPTENPTTPTLSLRSRCTTDDPFASDYNAAVAQEMHFSDWAGRNGWIARHDAGHHARNDLGPDNNNVTISVYWHVINAGTTYALGNLNLSDIQDQIAVLVSGFDGSGFNFTLVDVDYTTNVNWFNLQQGSTNEVIVKEYRHQGTAVDLNVYSCNPSNPGGDALGWSTFPWDYAAETYVDGVVVHWQSLPGGAEAPYNQGHTLIHEVGHWLGLYHTFQGGCCNGNSCGDYVSDTPAEGSAAYGCPTGRATCTDGKTDPIWDYMDYTTDACTEYFTWDQAVRAVDMWTMYRAGN